MNIQQRILLGPLAAIVLLIVFGGVAWQALRTQNIALREIKETRFEQAQNAAELSGRLTRAHVQLFGLVTWFTAYDKATQDRMLAETTKSLTAVIASFEAFQANARNGAEERQKLAEIAGLLAKYRKEVDAATNMVQLDVTSALGDMRAVAGHFASLEKAFDELNTLERRLADKTYADAQDAARGAMAINVVVLLLAIAIAGAIGWWTARRLLAQLGGEPALAAEVAGRIAQGDLTVQVPAAPAGSLIAAVGTMRHGLRDAMERMSASAAELAAAADQVAAASGTVAQRSSEQNDAAASMAAAIEQMSVSINNVAASAKDASETSTHSGATASDGARIVISATDEMRNIAAAVAEVQTAIRALAGHAEGISSVVTVISDVAAQTNLLALNAAIEAARAGEQGRGFAVVADEVRKLAERTTSSTAEIGAMIAAIQSSADSAIHAMDGAAQRVASGVELAGDAGAAIERIQVEARQVLASVTEISDALREQGTVTHDIANHVERIARMSNDNNAMAGESAAAATQLQALARGMREDVSRFRT